jgi:hypothetical protein
VCHRRAVFYVVRDVLTHALVARLFLRGGTRQVDLRHQGGVVQVRLLHVHRIRLCPTASDAWRAVVQGWGA